MEGGGEEGSEVLEPGVGAGRGSGKGSNICIRPRPKFKQRCPWIGIDKNNKKMVLFYDFISSARQ
jgi:hypothetical protein